MMSLPDILKTYGVDPRTIEPAEKPNDWWIIGTPSIVDGRGGGAEGYLCVRTILTPSGTRHIYEMPTCVGVALEDDGRRVRYYFRPIR